MTEFIVAPPETLDLDDGETITFVYKRKKVVNIRRTRKARGPTENQMLYKPVTNLRQMHHNLERFYPGYKEMSPRIRFRFSTVRPSQLATRVKARQITRNKRGEHPALCPLCDGTMYISPLQLKEGVVCPWCEEDVKAKPIKHKDRFLTSNEETINLLWWEVARLYAQLRGYAEKGEKEVKITLDGIDIYIANPKLHKIRSSYDQMRSDSDCADYVGSCMSLVSNLFPEKQGLLHRLQLAHDYLVNNDLQEFLMLRAQVEASHRGKRIEYDTPSGIHVISYAKEEKHFI